MHGLRCPRGLQASTAALSAFTAGTNPRDSLAEAAVSALPGEKKSFGAHYTPGLPRSGGEETPGSISQRNRMGWGKQPIFIAAPEPCPATFGSSLHHKQSERACVCVCYFFFFAIDHCQNVMPSRSANRLRGSNFMFPHKEHSDLTLASPLASSSPSVPPSAGARSFSTSTTPAKESREALPQGQNSHTAGFGSDHEVF